MKGVVQKTTDSIDDALHVEPVVKGEDCQPTRCQLIQAAETTSSVGHLQPR